MLDSTACMAKKCGRRLIATRWSKYSGVTLSMRVALVVGDVVDQHVDTTDIARSVSRHDGRAQGRQYRSRRTPGRTPRARHRRQRLAGTASVEVDEIRPCNPAPRSAHDVGADAAGATGDDDTAPAQVVEM
jgi:hypothetical protein